MQRARILLTVLTAAVFFAPASAQQVRQPPPYRILVSNDDGVRAPGIAAVAQILQAIGDVTIVAPAENHSGAGHSISTNNDAIFRDDLTLPNGLKAIGLTATPASTVNVAIRNIMKPLPDLVVSGINRGTNLGYSAYVSGTVGGARQAAMLGVPAIAASMAAAGVPQDLPYAAEEVLGVARRAKQYGLPPRTFLSVSIPAMPVDGYKGYLVTTLATQHGGEESFAETKHPSTGRPVYWNVYKEGASTKAPQGTDVWAVANGYVSVTPLQVGETDASQVDTLKAWFK
jgi:5'/3'-nucleotidase